jgi:hypothetical protein
MSFSHLITSIPDYFTNNHKKQKNLTLQSSNMETWVKNPTSKKEPKEKHATTTNLENEIFVALRGGAVGTFVPAA